MAINMAEFDTYWNTLQAICPDRDAWLETASAHLQTVLADPNLSDTYKEMATQTVEQVLWSLPPRPPSLPLLP